MADIPEWAIERAHSAVKVEGGVSPPRQSVPVRAFARYIASKEEPPVDPLLTEARKIVGAFMDATGEQAKAIEYRDGKWDNEEGVVIALEALRR